MFLFFFQTDMLGLSEWSSDDDVSISHSVFFSIHFLRWLDHTNFHVRNCGMNKTLVNNGIKTKLPTSNLVNNGINYLSLNW